MRTLITLLFAAGLLSAQEAAKPPERPDVKREAGVIQVKTLTGDAFERMVKMLSVFGCCISSDVQTRTILVNAPPEEIEQIKKAIAELDKPGSQAAMGHNIELTLSFLRCDAEPAAGPRQQPVPADLQAVARQLQAATQCQNPSLWDMVPMRMQEGKRAQQSMRLADANPVQGAFTIVNITMTPVAVGTKDNQGRYVRFDDVRIGFRVPVPTGPAGSGQFQYIDVGINTAGDFLESQKTVLGKVTGSEAETIFVVVALKILD